MILKYKNTVYEPIYVRTDDNVGLRDNDFWINIKFRLKNDDIDFTGDIPGMSFTELMKWNIMNKKFLDGKMKKNQKLTFIRRLGEIYYFPKQEIIEKRVFLFEDIHKYYPIYIEKEELKEIYSINKQFILDNMD